MNHYRAIDLRDQTIRAALRVIEILQMSTLDAESAEMFVKEGDAAMQDLELLKKELGL